MSPRAVVGRLGGRRLAALLGALAILGAMLVVQGPGSHVGAAGQREVVRSVASAGTYSWPSQGESAVGVPALGVASSSPREAEVPIASLTKMMTAYVALQILPLASGESGPCLTVTRADVATYDYFQSTDQSSVPVVAGERLCENTLLEGIFVHSAGNYAELLVQLTGVAPSRFVSIMNQTALQLGMDHTHYADVTGFSPASESDAMDQLRMVEAVMASPAVRDAARRTGVRLPGAGRVTTFTPLLGTEGVVGVKSGFTNAAGGCDALALETVRDGITFLTFAVDLGQQTGDVLADAGEAAWRLAHSAAARVTVTRSTSSAVAATVTWSSDDPASLVSDASDSAWRSQVGLTIAEAPFVTGTSGGTTQPVPLVLEPVGPQYPFSGLPDEWRTVPEEPGPTSDQTLIGDVELPGSPTVYMLLASTGDASSPSIWDDLL